MTCYLIDDLLQQMAALIQKMHIVTREYRQTCNG